MDYLSLIKTPISTELEEFRRLFDASLSSPNPLLQSVITHLRQKSGKMMRPMLVMLVARQYGPVTDKALHAAVSLELLHTASLVHDDVVDESGERRGQLSVNAVFNNKVAVLAGDYLLATSLVQVELTRDHRIVEVVARLGQDLAEGELAQVKVMEAYLPKQMSAEELEAALKEIIAEVGATSGKDMGKVMGVASKKLAGLAEGRAISAKVKELLG